MGKTGRGVGVGDQWTKPEDWELGVHVIELCFDRLEWVKVCLSLRMHSVSQDVAVVLGFSDCFFIGEYTVLNVKKCLEIHLH